MKKVFLLLLGFLSGSGYGWQQHFYIAAASTNVPAAFSTAAGSRVMTGLVTPRVITICNETATRICMNNQTYDGTTPTSDVTHRIPAGQCMSTASRFAPVVFISGCGSIISSGFVHGFAD